MHPGAKDFTPALARGSSQTLHLENPNVKSTGHHKQIISVTNAEIEAKRPETADQALTSPLSAPEAPDRQLWPKFPKNLPRAGVPA